MAVILFVGSNPSNASTCEIAFHASTKSSKLLTEWTKDIEGMKVHINVMNKATNSNRPLKASEITSNLPRLADDIKALEPTKIIALGKTAAKALTLLGENFYEMPHPSGCNRLLNDPEYVKGKIKGLLEYCSPTALQINSD